MFSNLHPNDPGRVMAIDLGEKRIGIALSDPTRLLATSHSVIRRRSRHDDFARYQAIIDENTVTHVIMGLPRRLDGSDSAMTRWVRDYAADCGEHLSVPLSLWDETFSSRQAHDVLKERGMNRRKRHARVDAVAAALFLQEYLDYQRTAAAVPPDSAETPTTP